MINKLSLTMFLFLIATSVKADNAVDIKVVKSASKTWTLTYTIDHPIKKLGFVRNPNNVRIQRWKPQNKEFEIIYKNNEEFIVKKDGASFSQVKFTLTPTWSNLRTDYGPFSPFTDGGLLFHSGRLFACIDQCNEKNNRWKVSLVVPDSEHIVVNGAIHKSSTEWYAKDDGEKVYVGKQKPVDGKHALTIIDHGIPEKLKLSLNNKIPKMMTYFEKKLGKLEYDTKPMLFASYAKATPGSQGGTLPNQIFIHWNGDQLEKRSTTEKFILDTNWFFAHEAAHLYQKSTYGAISPEQNQSWLHEGSANLLAYLALQETYPELKSYLVNKMDKSKARCIKGLKQTSLREASQNGHFELYYSCGLLIHKAINDAVKNKSAMKENFFTLWNKYRSDIKKGKHGGQDTFLALVEQYSSKKFSRQVKTFIDTKLENPERFIATFSD